MTRCASIVDVVLLDRMENEVVCRMLLTVNLLLQI